MLDYRSWGETKNCKGCRFWSEMIAKFDEGSLQAFCLQPDSPHSNEYTQGFYKCNFWDEGSLGAIDDPGGNPYRQEQNDGFSGR